MILAVGLLLLGHLAIPSASLAVSKTYTTDADFDEGLLFNINHAFPNNDQLQLNDETTPFPFINIACSGRGTVVRVHVETGEILGEYLSAPNGMGRNPSRTTVDQFGNVWVANRDESGWSVDENKGSVTRIALIIGGTRCDADGTENPMGQYLKPPFDYSTAVDRDLDGLIKTSRGLGNILPWTNAGGTDTHGGVSTAEDECIINYTRVAGTGTRTVAVDGHNDVWTGGTGDRDHEKIDGVTGAVIPGTKFNFGCGGYGGVVDPAGVLWSARGLLRYDPIGGIGVCLPVSNSYGLAIDCAGHVWNSRWTNNTITELAPDGTILNTYSSGGSGSRGVAVTSDCDIWIANSHSNSVTRLDHTDGSLIEAVPVGAEPTGVAVDANGKVWVTNYTSNNAMRIDPTGGPHGLGGVDLTVDLGGGANPYNYSDMTGAVVIGVLFGFWDVVFDSGILGIEWGTASWNSYEPDGTSIIVEVRAADSIADLPNMTFAPVMNAVPFSGILGQFIEIRVSFERESQDIESPILYDLTIEALRQIPNCPRSAGFWKQQCRQNPNGSTKFTLGEMVDIAACADVESEFFDWEESMELTGLCEAIVPETPMTARTQALRQFGAFLANVCVGQLGYIAANGDSIGLNTYSAYECNGLEAETIGEVLTEVDALLIELEAMPPDDPEVIDSYEDIIFCLDDINNGVGLEDPCDEVQELLVDGRSIASEVPTSEGDEWAFLGPKPNPFVQSTQIIYSVEGKISQRVEIAIFNVAGQQVRRLLSTTQSPGIHEVRWDGDDDQGVSVPAGLYFYRVDMDTQSVGKRLILMR